MFGKTRGFLDTNETSRPKASEGGYVARRDGKIRRSLAEGRGCQPCARFAASLLARGGELERFRHVCGIRQREDRQGIRSIEDRALRTWRQLRVWQGDYEPGFSMRGRGGRREEFEAWFEEVYGREPPGGQSGRRGLLEVTVGPEVDVRACLEDLEAWAEHLTEQTDPVAHVEETFGPPPKSWGKPLLRPERGRVSRLAGRVKDYVQDLQERNRETRRGRRPKLSTLAHRMLADLSRGYLDKNQIRDLARR